jgi:hypothetical protein
VLAIFIENQEPLGLGQIIALLTAVRRDYATITSRELTLLAARQGSLELQLVDLLKHGLEAAGAVVTMKEFVQLVGKAMNAVRERASSLNNRRLKGVKTVRAMLDASRDSNADISIDYRDEAEHISVRLTRQQAEQIYLENERPLPDERTAHPIRAKQIDRDLADFVAAAARLSDDPALLEQEGSPAYELAKVTVRVLRQQKDGAERLRRVSEELQGSGRGEAARLLERLIAAD